MLHPTPDWRYQLILTSTKGTDPVVDSILEGPPSEAFKSIQSLHSNSFLRMYIQASLLATSDYGHISEVLEINQVEVELYAKIFYDTEGFNKLLKLSMLDSVTNKEERVLKLWAISQGMDFIAWRLGKKINISALDGLTALFNDCIYKSKEAIFNENVSDASKESVKWVKLSVEIAKLLKLWILDGAAATNDIRIALKQIMPDFENSDFLENELKPGETGDLFDETNT